MTKRKSRGPETGRQHAPKIPTSEVGVEPTVQSAVRKIKDGLTRNPEKCGTLQQQQQQQQTLRKKTSMYTW